MPCLGAQEILESRKCAEAAQLVRTAVTGKAHRWQHQPDEASASSGGPPAVQTGSYCLIAYRFAGFGARRSLCEPPLPPLPTTLDGTPD